MFESEFGHAPAEQAGAVAPEFRSRLQPGDVESMQLLYWREHCLECAPPDCYHSCELYSRRVDGRCVRFDYGIARNRDFAGALDFGADIRFRRWAKLETVLYDRRVTTEMHRRLDRADEHAGVAVNQVARVASVVYPLRRMKKNPQRTTYKTLAYVRERGLRSLTPSRQDSDPTVLVVECYSFEAQPFNLIIEYARDVVAGRVALAIEPGQNYFEVPAAQLGGRLADGKLSVYPENDATVRVVFTWLDLVTKRAVARPAGAAAAQLVPAAKAKCVAWDLDGVMWNGILIEDGVENLTVRPETVAAIKELDRRGIIHTIVSKNDYAAAWGALERFDLAEYFVFPAINWSPKSANLLEVARRINIGIDTFVFVDDSPFERAEVSETVAGIRVYSDEEIPSLTERPEFDVPVTEMSAQRRHTYQREVERERVRESFGSDYEEFLRSCTMRLRIFVPERPADRHRCWELLQRSNQLNLSSRRYTSEEFAELLSQEGLLCLAMDCADRFGTYGIVGFVSVDETGREPRIVDFAMSCRVAQKRVEDALFRWIAGRERARGATALCATLNKTKKNSPLIEVFRHLPFEVTSEDATALALRLPLDRPDPAEPIVTVTSEVDGAAVPTHAGSK